MKIEKTNYKRKKTFKKTLNYKRKKTFKKTL